MDGPDYPVFEIDSPEVGRDRAGASRNARMSRLLVLHQGALGDFVLALSVVQPLRRVLGCSHVAAIAGAASARLAAGRSVIDVAVAPDAVGLHTLFTVTADGGLASRLAAHLGEAAVVLSFLGDAAGSIHRRLCTASAGRVLSIDPRPTPETLAARRHITQAWAEALRSQGVAIAPEPPEIRTTGDHLRGTASDGVSGPGGTDRRLRSVREGVVLIHPGSGGAAKCWPIERFMELADRVGREAKVRWMLGPAELERDQERLAPLRRRIERSGETLIVEEDLTRAAERVGDADLYIGNDAGMTHVGAAIGVPTVAIFTATDPAVWRPLNANARVVSAESCGGSDVSVEAVWRVISNE